MPLDELMLTKLLQELVLRLPFLSSNMVVDAVQPSGEALKTNENTINSIYFT